MFTKEVALYSNAYGTQAVLKQWSDGTWFVDFGCMLWNREYKTRRGAEKYLEKQGCFLCVDYMA